MELKEKMLEEVFLCAPVDDVSGPVCARLGGALTSGAADGPLPTSAGPSVRRDVRLVDVSESHRARAGGA